MAMFALAAALVGAVTVTQGDVLCPNLITCPDANNTVVAAGDDFFKVECDANRAYGDMDLSGLPLQGSLEDCINECQGTDGCIALAWNPGPKNCYIKSTIGALETPRPDVWGAIMIQGPRLTQATAVSFTPCPTATSALPASTSSLTQSMSTTTAHSATSKFTSMAAAVSKSSTQSSSVKLGSSTTKPNSASDSSSTPSSVAPPEYGTATRTKETVPQSYPMNGSARPTSITKPSSGGTMSTSTVSRKTSFPVYGGYTFDTSCSSSNYYKSGWTADSPVFPGAGGVSEYGGYGVRTLQTSFFRFARSLKVSSSPSTHLSTTSAASKTQASTSASAPIVIIPVIGSISTDQSTKAKSASQKVDSAKSQKTPRVSKSSSTSHTATSLKVEATSPSRKTSSTDVKSTPTSHKTSSTAKTPATTNPMTTTPKQTPSSTAQPILNTWVTDSKSSASSPSRLQDTLTFGGTATVLPSSASTKNQTKSINDISLAPSDVSVSSSSSTFMLSTASTQSSQNVTMARTLNSIMASTSTSSNTISSKSSSVLSGNGQPVPTGFGSSYMSALSAQQSSAAAQRMSPPNSPTTTTSADTAAGSALPQSNSTTHTRNLPASLQPVPAGFGSSYMSALSAQQASISMHLASLSNPPTMTTSTGSTDAALPPNSPSYINGAAYADSGFTSLNSTSLVAPSGITMSTAAASPSLQAMVTTETDAMAPASAQPMTAEDGESNEDGLSDVDSEDNDSTQDDSDSDETSDDGSDGDDSSDDETDEALSNPSQADTLNRTSLPNPSTSDIPVSVFIPQIETSSNVLAESSSGTARVDESIASSDATDLSSDSAAILIASPKSSTLISGSSNDDTAVLLDDQSDLESDNADDGNESDSDNESSNESDSESSDDDGDNDDSDEGEESDNGEESDTTDNSDDSDTTDNGDDSDTTEAGDDNYDDAS